LGAGREIPRQAKDLRLRDAIARLVQLYEATNKPVEAEKWRLELEEATAANQRDRKVTTAGIRSMLSRHVRRYPISSMPSTLAIPRPPTSFAPRLRGTPQVSAAQQNDGGKAGQTLDATASCTRRICGWLATSSLRTAAFLRSGGRGHAAEFWSERRGASRASARRRTAAARFSPSRTSPPKQMPDEFLPCRRRCEASWHRFA